MSGVRLLVLAVGTQVGQNILTTLRHRRGELHLVATSSVAHEPAVFDYDVVYLVPETSSDSTAFEERIVEIIEREHIGLVVPCRDDDVAFLSSLREHHPALAARLLCGSARAAQIIVDKWTSAVFSREQGLPFAATLLGGAGTHPSATVDFSRTYGFPLVAKPRRGYASQDVFLITDHVQLERAMQSDQWVVQEYLGDPSHVDEFLSSLARRGIPLYHTFQGLKHSIQALIGPDGDIVDMICTRNRNERRRSKWVGPDPDPAARELGSRCAAAFSSAGWRGPLNIQCQQSRHGEIRIHEFNGRFTGATADRWLLGFDEVGLAVHAFTGKILSADRVGPDRAREVFESLIARAANPRDVDLLSRDGVWRAP